MFNWGWRSVHGFTRVLYGLLLPRNKMGKFQVVLHNIYDIRMYINIYIY